MVADLVLEGYDVNLAVRDSEPYEGLDGVSIHGGDHLHDPCLSYTGERFTLVGSGGSARGFLVVNDCQVVQCTKWNTEDGKTGGETIFYDLVANPTATRTRWKVQEPGKCTCGVKIEQETCYVGNFIHANFFSGQDYSSDCGIAGNPGSIACDPANTFTTAQITWDTMEKAGVSLVAILGTIAVALVLFCLCCRCRHSRRFNINAHGGKQQQQEARAVNDVIVAPALVHEGKNIGWFGGGGGNRGALKHKKTPEPAVDAAEVRKEEAEVPPKKRRWLGGKTRNKLKDVAATTDTIPSIIDQEDENPNIKRWGLFWAGKAKEDTLSIENNKITVVEEPVIEKKRGWFGGSKKECALYVEEINKEEQQSLEKDKRKGWNFFWERKTSDSRNNEKATVDSEMPPAQEADNKGIPQNTPRKFKKKMNEKPKANKQETSVPKPEAEGVDCTCCGI